MLLKNQPDGLQVEFGGEVDLWATLNEPFTAVILPGYLFQTATRTNPPGIAIQPEPVFSTYARSTKLREYKWPLSQTGAVESATCSCATYS